jgi:polysaccharide export outer membrane protein
MKLGLVAAGAAVLVSAGCSSPQLVGSESVRVVDAASLPPPSRADVAAPSRPYLIGPFDQLTVDVFGVPELSREIQADASGRISLPLVGTVEAAGKTPAELAQLIAAGLRGRYVRDPQVSVNLTETVSQVITVDGEVTEPGVYPVVGRMTLMRAIARAKGLTEFARANHVVVFRQVGGQQMAALYDLRAIRQGLYDDPEVFANDVVTVGESRARRIFRDVIQSGGLLTAPIIALLQQR